MNKSEIIVIGDGWAALSIAAQLGLAGKSVYWLAGTSPRLALPLPGIESGVAIEVIKSLSKKFEFDIGDSLEGNFVREFKNKTFRISSKENLWTPESWFTNPMESKSSGSESRFNLTLNEIMDLIREKTLQLPSIQRVEGILFEKFIIQEGRLCGITLSTGEEIACELAIFADRQKLSDRFDVFRGRDSVGALQATFIHDSPLLVGTLEGFYSAIQHETGDEFERHVFGYFSSHGLKSIWTLFLTPEEAEDNHEITKKYRRIKQAVEKMFAGSPWLPSGKSKFMDTVKEEQVKWIDHAAFCKGDPLRTPTVLPKTAGLYLLTDGYGPASALCQVDTLIREEPKLILKS